MKELDELLQKYRATAEEIKTFYKVQTFFYLEDLKYILCNVNDIETYTTEEIDNIKNNILNIIERYDDIRGENEDWYGSMLDAINFYAR